MRTTEKVNLFHFVKNNLEATRTMALYQGKQDYSSISLTPPEAVKDISKDGIEMVHHKVQYYKLQ